MLSTTRCRTACAARGPELPLPRARMCCVRDRLLQMSPRPARSPNWPRSQTGLRSRHSHYRYHPLTLRIEEIIASGGVGKPQRVEADRWHLSRCRSSAPQAGLNANPLPQMAIRITSGMPRRPMGGDDRSDQLAKCTWFTCAATRKALAAIVKLGFKPALEGKNEPSTT